LTNFFSEVNSSEELKQNVKNKLSQQWVYCHLSEDTM